MSGNTLTLEIGPTETVHCWQKMPNCDEFVGARRSKHTVVAFEESVYVFGGDNGKNMLNDLLRFDVKEKSWVRAIATGTPPSPRYHHSAVVFRHSMFVFGGYTGDIHSNSNLSNRNDLFEYSFRSGQWTEWRYTGVGGGGGVGVTAAPEPRSAHGAVIFDNKLWIFAGYDGNARLNDMWCMPLTGDSHTWQKIAQKGECPPTCCNFPATVARNKMYVFSGQSGAQITNSLFAFDFKSCVWTRITSSHLLREAPAPPVRRYGHTMVAFERHLYVFGGAADSTLSADLHAFDLDSELWFTIETPSPTEESTVPAGRLFHAAAVIADAMFIFGGTVDNNVRSAEMYRLQLCSYPRCTLHDDFGRLLHTTKPHRLHDCRFIVGGGDVDAPRQIDAHMAIVAARSEYLRARLKSALKNQRNSTATQTNSSSDSCLVVVELTEADPLAFELILQYMYMDCIDLSCLNRVDSSQSVLKILDVYRLAQQFQLLRLVELCVQHLNATIHTNNVLEALLAAHNLNLAVIKAFCLAYIVKDTNYKAIIMTERFEVLPKQLLVEIIRLKAVPPQQQQHSTTSSTISGSGGDIVPTILDGDCGRLEYDMAEFLSRNDADFYDIELVLDERPVAAHKCVLAARAAYFEAMFRSFMPADGRVNIQIGDVVPSMQSFHSLLRYIYCGGVRMPPEDSLYLITAPAFYSFTNNRLQTFCKHNLEMNVCIENVLQILEAADDLQAADMKSYALRLIAHNFKEVVRLPRLQALSKQLILEVLVTLGKELNEIRSCRDI